MEWLLIPLVPIAYFVGTFPSAIVVARARGIDITAHGSGNPGTSNVVRVIGWKAGAIVLVTDFAKGAISAGGGLLVAERPGAYLLGAVAVIGHTFPLGRRGGKGVAAAGGMLVVLFPIVLPMLAAVWFAVVKLTRKASVASLLVCAAFPVAAVIDGRAGWEIGVLSVMALLLIARHSGNIRRLWRREESDLVANQPR